MTDLHATLADAAVRRGVEAPCWFCGAPTPQRGDLPPVCEDTAACFARSVRPPPGPPVCLCGGRGYHSDPDDPEGPLDVYCACEAGTRRWKRETGQEESGA